MRRPTTPDSGRVPNQLCAVQFFGRPPVQPRDSKLTPERYAATPRRRNGNAARHPFGLIKRRVLFLQSVEVELPQIETCRDRLEHVLQPILDQEEIKLSI